MTSGQQGHAESESLEQSSGPSEMWKERLGFVSGSIVVCAVVLLKLSPLAARQQLPDGYVLISESGRANAAALTFSLLTLLSALGGTILLFAIVHLLSRGFWLANEAREVETTGESSQRLAALCLRSFVSVFSVTKIALLVATVYPFMVAAIAVQHRLHDAWSLETKLAGTIVFFAIFIVFLLPIQAIVALALRSKGGLFKTWDRLTGEMSLSALGVLFIFVCFTNIFYWGSTTAELQISRSAVYQSKKEAVEVSLTLGGITSQPDKAELRLLDVETGEVLSELEAVALGDGLFVSVIHAASLRPGVYEVEFIYDFGGISLDYPYIFRETRRTKRFIVAE